MNRFILAVVLIFILAGCAYTKTAIEFEFLKISFLEEVDGREMNNILKLKDTK